MYAMHNNNTGLLFAKITIGLVFHNLVACSTFVILPYALSGKRTKCLWR